MLERTTDTIEQLKKALDGSEGYREQLMRDPIFKQLHSDEQFQQLIKDETSVSSES